jgi:putative zinc finger/helix-turn-helix YgiT family protein
MEKKNEFCTNCLKEVSFHEEKIKEKAMVRGVVVEAEHTHCFCDECGEEIIVNSILDENLKNSFEAYKKKMGLLTGKEIRSFRDQYSLTAVELADLLGAGEKTITRYENGAIQDPVYEKILRSFQNADAFYLYLIQNKKTIEPALFQRLMSQMNRQNEEDIKAVYSFVDSIESGFTDFVRTSMNEHLKVNHVGDVEYCLTLAKKGSNHGNKISPVETQSLFC